MCKATKTLLTISAILTTLFFSPSARAQVSLNYLGDLGGDYSVAYGINDSGQVVGLSAISPSQPEQAVETDAFLYTPGVGMQD